MQITANNTDRFLITSLSLNGMAGAEPAVSSVGLCQQIILSRVAHCSHLSNTRQAFVLLTDRLIRLAEHFQSLRDTDLLEEVGRVLVQLPIDNAQKIGQYYQYVAVTWRGQIDEAKWRFESIASYAPITYRARALQCLRDIAWQQGELQECLKFQTEALKAAPDTLRGLQAKLAAHFTISILKSVLGDHEGALSNLESLAPMVRLVAQNYPYYCYSYHNALAVELGELGRVEEGQANLAVALNSPYALSHPEWCETREELTAKQRKASSSQISLACSSAAKPSPGEHPGQKRFITISLLIRLSLSKENLILLVTTRTATRQSGLGFILDRIFGHIKPRGPPLPSGGSQ